MSIVNIDQKFLCTCMRYHFFKMQTMLQCQDRIVFFMLLPLVRRHLSDHILWYLFQSSLHILHLTVKTTSVLLVALTRLLYFFTFKSFISIRICLNSITLTLTWPHLTRLLLSLAYNSTVYFLGLSTG